MLAQAPQRGTSFGMGKHWNTLPVARSQDSPAAALQPSLVTGLHAEADL